MAESDGICHKLIQPGCWPYKNGPNKAKINIIVNVFLNIQGEMSMMSNIRLGVYITFIIKMSTVIGTTFSSFFYLLNIHKLFQCHTIDVSLQNIIDMLYYIEFSRIHNGVI